VSTVDEALASDTAQFVTFTLDDERYGIPMDQVQEIIRMPRLVRVPLGPPSLRGVANLRGRVLPVISIRGCCGLAEAEQTDATRVIVVGVAGTVGLVVDQVSSVLSMDAASVETVGGGGAMLTSEIVAGVMKAPDGMVTAVNVEQVIRSRFPQLGQVIRDAGYPAGAAVSEPTHDPEETTGISELVTFMVDGQEYALPIDQVREILAAPRAINRIPDAAVRVLGMVDLRGTLLPVLSVRRMFGLPDAVLDGQSRILVVSVDGRRAVGLVTDEVREVLRVATALISPLPAAASVGRASDVDSVCRLAGGARLVSVLSLERMFADAAWRSELEAAGAGIDEAQQAELGSVPAEWEDGDMDDDRRDEALLVVFWLDGAQYAVDIDHVQEIIRVPSQLIRVPNAPGNVQGLVSLRGGVLPVVDLRGRLGLPAAERDDRQRIIVLTRGGEGGPRTGFIVDSVLEVARVPRQSIEPAPDLSAEQAAVVSTVANLARQGRLVLIAEAARLVGGTPAQDRLPAELDLDPDVAMVADAVLAMARA
jgi:purine-binding chemotaxis protein CheW